MKTAHANCTKQRQGKGFTLTELLMVVVIVAILAAIAIPSYRNQVVKTNRSDAMAVLQGFAQAMERYYAQNNTYATAVVGTVFPSKSPLDGPARYGLSFKSLTASTYVLKATPTAGGTQVGDGVLELSNTGRRGWDRNGDGDTDDTGENTWDAH